MKTIFRNYKSNDDYLRIRDLLVYTYKLFGEPVNWTIERWNFSRSMARIMNRVSLQQWEEKIGIWESNGNIIGVVNPEGEGDGEAFFQIGIINIPNNILEEMFEFSEKNLTIEKDGKHIVQLRIPDGDKQRESIALSRGYIKQQWYETISVIPIEGIPDVKLPKGFSLKSGLEVSDTEKGVAHSKAFGYLNTKTAKLSPLAYESLRQTPDYRQDLDIYLISESNEIVSFCTMWYDEFNKIGILEPVGTIPNFRKKGLGRAVVEEALKRIAKEGAIKVYVGSGQDFYTNIGFRKEYKNNIWEKIVK